MTFVGAVIGMRKHAHPASTYCRRATRSRAQNLLGHQPGYQTVCSLYMLYGTWLQHDIIASNASPVMQMSMSAFGISYLTGAAITVICVANLLRLAFGHVEERELIDVQEEGIEEAHEIEHELEEQEKDYAAKHGGTPT
jgi:TRAP-type C4-dicarboxylate transport system permease small subunit